MSSQLALFGGEKAVTLSGPGWPRLSQEQIDAGVNAIQHVNENARHMTAAGGGGVMEEFENAFRERVGAGYGFSTGGAGQSLHIAVMACTEAGDEVICSPYSWGQTAGAILQGVAIPVYADIDPDSYTLDPAKIEEKITDATSAIVVVHIYGHPADMPAILEIARKHDLRVIEDCAQAAVATIDGQPVGTFGDIGCFSIGSGKNLAVGEGGMLVTGDEDLYRRAALVGLHPARHGKIVAGTHYERYVDSIGFTYRAQPISCAMALAGLPHLEQWNSWRRANAERFSEGLQGIPGIDPVKVREGCTHVYHMYCPTYRAEELGGLSRERFTEALSAEGVGVGAYVRVPIHLRPMHLEHEFYFGRACPWSCHPQGREITYAQGDCPVAERRCAQEELSIGGFGGWIEDQRPLVDEMIAACRKVAEHADELLEGDDAE